METFEIILSVIIVFLGFILSYKWKKLSKFLKIILSIFILLTIVLTIVQIKNNIYEKAKEELIERISSDFGELDFDGELMPRIMLGNSDKSASFYVRNSNSLGLTISHPEYGPMIRVSIKKGKLNANVLIRDFKGEVIAVIEGDTWTVYDDNYEYNDDDGKAFELVTRGERKVFFQIEYRNKFVHISGYFITEEGYGFAIYNIDQKEGRSVFMLLTTKAK